MYDRFLDALMDVSSDCMYVINGGKVYSDDNEFVDGAISDDFPLLDDILYDFHEAIIGNKYNFTKKDLFDDDNFEIYLEDRDNIVKKYLEVDTKRREFINKPKSERKARKREELMSLGYEVYNRDRLYAVCDYEDSANVLIKKIVDDEFSFIKEYLIELRDQCNRTGVYMLQKRFDKCACDAGLFYRISVIVKNFKDE